MMPTSDGWITDPLQIAHWFLEHGGKIDMCVIWCDCCPLNKAPGLGIDNHLECDCGTTGEKTLERIKAWLAENEPEGMC